jgi:hypothetical protein
MFDRLSLLFYLFMVDHQISTKKKIWPEKLTALENKKK